MIKSDFRKSLKDYKRLLKEANFVIIRKSYVFYFQN